MKKLLKVPLGIFCIPILTALFCLFMAPAQAQAAALPMISGNADWNFNAVTGELSITGSGRVDSLYRNNYSDIPWYSVRHDITSVRMDSTVQPTSLRAWFTECTSLQSVDSAQWDVSHVTEMSELFEDCGNLRNVDVSNWNTSAVTNMWGMFYGCSALTNLDVSNWNTAAVTDMSCLFYNCSALSSLDTSNWNTAAVTNMWGMFYNCKALANLSVNIWNTAAVTNMSEMFYGCEALAGLDVSNWNTAATTNMWELFYRCKSLTSFDVSSWNTSAVTDMTNMFADCASLNKVTFGPDWQFKGNDAAAFPQANQGNDPVYLQKWQAIGTGSITDPKGTQYSETELMTYYNQPRHMKETYILAKATTYYFVDFADGKPVGVTDAVQNLPSTIQAETTQNATVPAQIPTLAGYTFKGYSWNGALLMPGATIDKQAADVHITLTATWGKDAPVADYYYVDFADGRPTNAPDEVQNLPGTIKSETTQDATVPMQFPTLNGYIIMGYSWNGKVYIPGETIDKQPADTHVILTAIWVENPFKSPKKDPGTGDPTTTSTTDAKLPQTGDTSAFVVSGVVIGAIAALVCSYRVRTRA